MEKASESCGTGYEWKALALLPIGSGLVGIDRFMLMPLFPIILQERHLDCRDLGITAGALAIAGGVSSIVMGTLSARVGHRKVTIPAMFVFSLLFSASGFAASRDSLILIGLANFAQGACTPVSNIATVDAWKPTWHGFNVGLQQTMMPLLSLGLSPILVSQLSRLVSWNWIFTLASVHGLIIAYFLHRVLRDSDAQAAAKHTETRDTTRHETKLTTGQILSDLRASLRRGNDGYVHSA